MVNTVQPLHLTGLQINQRLETLNHCPNYDMVVLSHRSIHWSFPDIQGGRTLGGEGITHDYYELEGRTKSFGVALEVESSIQESTQNQWFKDVHLPRILIKPIRK